MTDQVKDFLNTYHFPVEPDIDSVVKALCRDMELGLYGGKEKAGQLMIKTWMLPCETQAVNKDVIVIDAGGTNFRSCLVHFNEAGTPEISHFEKNKMPAVDRELSRKEFFDVIAGHLEHLKDKAPVIGFCFSYGMRITPEGDGIVQGFSKEVKAPEVVGQKVGACLLEALRSHGWNSVQKIVLLNDTVAALLSGATIQEKGLSYSSYVGFILGTGINTAYIQSENKEKGLEKQIIVCEAGMCDKVQQSDFDKLLDSKTTNPGTYLLEKMCSGGYLGPLCRNMLLQAAADGLFSSETTACLLKLGNLTTIEVDNFLQEPLTPGTVHNLLEKGTGEDLKRVYELFSACVNRTAVYGAAMVSAAVLASGEGTAPEKPVCVACNGTTLFKTHELLDIFKGQLHAYLNCRMGRYYRLVVRENDITLGSAIAALSKMQ